jgi:hypothetical protein
MSLVLGFVVHVALLGADYAKMTGLFRAEQDAQGYFGWMLLAHLLIGIGFAWVYMKGREDKPWLAQGVRFGLAVAVLATIPTYLIYYAVEPIPGAVVAKQIVFDTIVVVLMGIVCAWINRTRAAAPA